MHRLARLDAPGVLHHIMIRGIDRRKIFLKLKESRGVCFEQVVVLLMAREDILETIEHPNQDKYPG